MLVKTSGIAIRNTRYSDSSIITKIYTRTLGMQSYMVRGIRSPKAAIKPSLLQPLTLLELVAYNTPGKDIQHLKEAVAKPSLHDLHFNVLKSAIGLFVAEIINRSVKEEESNERLYDFAQRFILMLDDAQEELSMYPLWFSIHLTKYLGFFPHGNMHHDKQVFNLMDGGFTDHAETPHIIDSPYSGDLSAILPADKPELIKLPKSSRIHLLDKIMEYYTLHIPAFGNMRSLPVLNSVLRDA
jgi:DNA repair protein RecO (recombination protein O)